VGIGGRRGAARQPRRLGVPPRVELADARGEGPHDLERERRRLVDQEQERPLVDHRDAGGFCRHGREAARRVVDDRQLAERPVGTHGRDRVLPVAQQDEPRDHAVHQGTGVPLLKHDVTRLEVEELGGADEHTSDGHRSVPSEHPASNSDTLTRQGPGREH
jgi:hypothetical protein